MNAYHTAAQSKYFNNNPSDSFVKIDPKEWRLCWQLSLLYPKERVGRENLGSCSSISRSILLLSFFCSSILLLIWPRPRGRPPSTASVQSCGLAARWMSLDGDGIWSLAFHSVTRATCGSALAIKASSAHVHCMTRQMNPFFFLPHFPNYIRSIWPLSFNHISEDAFFFAWWISLLSRVRRILPFFWIKCFL